MGDRLKQKIGHPFADFQDDVADEPFANNDIRATKAAHNSLLDIEELSEADLDRIKARFERLAHIARAEVNVGQPDAARSAPLTPAGL